MTISPNIHERKKYRFTYTYLMRGSFEKYANAGNNSYKYHIRLWELKVADAIIALFS